MRLIVVLHFGRQAECPGPTCLAGIGPGYGVEPSQELAGKRFSRFSHVCHPPFPPPGPPHPQKDKDK